MCCWDSIRIAIWSIARWQRIAELDERFRVVLVTNKARRWELARAFGGS